MSLKLIKTLVGLALLSLATIGSSKSLAASVITNLSSGSFTEISDYTVGPSPVSTSTSLELSGVVTSESSFVGSFGTNPSAPIPFNLSSYTDLALLMSYTGSANPNLTFSVSLYKLDQTSAAFFLGSTTGLTGTPSLVNLVYQSEFGSRTSVAISDLTDVAYFEFGWQGDGTVTTTSLYSLQAVPEPSTGALMLLGAVGLAALRRLRKV